MRRFPKTNQKEFSVFKTLNTAGKVQDFLNKIPMNRRGGKRRTCRSPLYVLRHREADCMEGAMLAAAAFWYHGQPPFVLDLKTTPRDDDHVVALFRRGRRWGAASKTNHAVLRYRDAVYRDPRELVMSYFNEYFLEDGQKTLRSHSAPFDLSKYGDGWLTSREHLWDIPWDLDRARHFGILGKNGARMLRPVEPIERKMLAFEEWK